VIIRPMAEYLFPLKERFEVAEGTMAFVFKTPDFSFRAGQYIEVELIAPSYTDEKGNERHFSIASSPNDKGILMVATRMRPSAFKRSLAEIPLGTEVKIKGPRGNFVLHENPSKKAVFIAGGIGITPARSIIKYATQEKLPHKITLIYSNRNPKSAAFLDDLQKLENENKNFKLIARMTDTEGYVDAALIQKSAGDLKDVIFYEVGPPGMVEAMTKILEELKISRDELRFEEFSGY
ncbi:MAG: FAD-dependent oxidoreductase, partial [Patescibacteria group bacterium]